jgi:hypothetical protein
MLDAYQRWLAIHGPVVCLRSEEGDGLPLFFFLPDFHSREGGI